MAGNCTGLDVVGIGVRMSIYVQSLVTLLYPALVAIVTRGGGQPTRRAERVLRYTLLATSCGVLLTALAKARRGQLTLAQALIVLRLAWLVSYTTHSIAVAAWLPMFGNTSSSTKPAPPGEASEDGNKVKSLAITWGYTTILHLMFMGAVGLWVFTRPSRFSTDTCSAAASVPLPSFPHRIFWLLVYTACIVPPLNGQLMLLSIYPVLFTISFVGGTVYHLCVRLSGNSAHVTYSVHVPYAEHVARAVHTVDKYDILRLAPLASGLVLAGAIAAFAEAAVGSASQWTLGQTLALLLAVPGLRAAARDMWSKDNAHVGEGRPRG